MTPEVREQLPIEASRYLELVAEVPLRPIRSEAELDRAIAMIDRLTDLDELTLEEEDYRSVLGGLVATYEDEAYPEPRSPRPRCSDP